MNERFDPISIKGGQALVTPGGLYELRIPHWEFQGGTAAGFFDDPGKPAKALAGCSGHAPGIYLTLNPLPVAAGDEIATSSSAAMIYFADKSRATIAPNSKIRLEAHNASVARRIVSGSVDLTRAIGSRISLIEAARTEALSTAPRRPSPPPPAKPPVPPPPKPPTPKPPVPTPPKPTPPRPPTPPPPPPRSPHCPPHDPDCR